MAKLTPLLLLFFSAVYGYSIVQEAGPGHDVKKYGPMLPAIAELGVGPGLSMDVSGDFVYSVGDGVLIIADISNPGSPKLVGRLENLGITRQIEVRDKIAYIAARGDGLFIVDVSDPTAPSLLSKYDTIEFATGLTLGGDLVFLACRLFGIELVDISDPRKPEHVGIARTGVSQSAVYSDGFLYVGVWGEMKVVVVDVRDPRNPVITDNLPMDGYGDGVAVYEGYHYAATGQHSRAKPRENPGDPGFGTGHGLEVFSLSDPAHPKPVSRTKFPPEMHTDSHLWAVRVANGHAFVADNYNGLFVLDISDPAHPVFVGQHQLPYNEERKGPYIISGLSVIKDHVLVTSPYIDARVIKAFGIATAVQDYSGRPPVISPREMNRKTDDYRAYYMGGQVYSVVRDGDIAYVAAGQGGLHLVQVWPKFKRLRHIPTEDRPLDVYSKNDYLYVAEGTEGLAIMRKTSERDLALVGRYATPGEFARQVIVPAPGDIAVLMVGPGRIHVVGLRDPANPRRVFEDSREGILTGDNIADGLFLDRYAAVYWHKSGNYHKPTDCIRWYDLKDSSDVKLAAETTLGRIDTANGVTVLGNKLLVVANGGYRLIDALEKRNLQSLPAIKISGNPVIGKPTVDGNRLYISHRAGGEVYIIDIEAFEQPRLIDSFVTSANPARIVPHPHCLLIPGGYEGLLIYDLP
ncbi:MAG: beta-propeller domain-containing protein [Verrucomicrobiae bacterium]|nr:beta-propeller domain-containing protein [Verrucomicrobiae bacterium]